MNVLTKGDRLQLILTYYLLWKIKTAPRAVRKVVRYTTPRATPFSKSDLLGASIADLGTKDHDLLDGLLDDDHTQYLPLTCIRDLTGDLGFDVKTRKIDWGLNAYIEGQDFGGRDGISIYSPDAIRLEGNITCTGQANFEAYFMMRGASNITPFYLLNDQQIKVHNGAAFVTVAGWDDTATAENMYLTRAGDITQIANKTIVFAESTALTIVGGVITIAGTNTVITPQGGANDDLDSILGGTDGQIIIIRGDGTFAVTAKDGIGNLSLTADFVMDHQHDTLTLMYDGTNTQWLELSRSNNA